jgi:hypothetical protein
MKATIVPCPHCKNHPVIVFAVKNQPVLGGGVHSKSEGLMLFGALCRFGYITPKEMHQFTKDILSNPNLSDVDPVDMIKCTTLHREPDPIKKRFGNN